MNLKLNKVSLPKIISEQCELVKLRNINCSGQVVCETHCSLTLCLRVL